VKRLGSIVFALFLALSWDRAQAVEAGPAPELAALKSAYNAALREAESNEVVRLNALRKDYFAALFELQDRRMERDDFTGVLAIKTELERFEYKQEISDDQKEQMFPELRALRERYMASRDQIAAEREKAAVARRQKQVADLASLARKFELNGDAAGAAAVRAELATVQGVTAPPAAAGAATTGRFTLRAYIDGADYIHVQGSRIWYVHEAGPFPGKSGTARVEPTYINTTAWMPVWNGYESRPYEQLQPPLRVAANKRVYMTRKFGRGEVILVEQPVVTNRYTLQILIDDRTHPGADWYEIHVKW
jgi:hypothetical protein